MRDEIGGDGRAPYVFTDARGNNGVAGEEFARVKNLSSIQTYDLYRASRAVGGARRIQSFPTTYKLAIRSHELIGNNRGCRV